MSLLTRNPAFQRCPPITFKTHPFPMRTTHHHLCKNFGRLIAGCAVLFMTVPGPGGQVTAQSAQNDDILAYDDFSGPAGDLNGRVTPHGGAEWFTHGDASALVLDGEGRAVVSGEFHEPGKRKYAWLEVQPKGDEYYVAARLAYTGEGGGWGAIGFAGIEGGKEPLLASALFAVTQGRLGGAGYTWINNENPGQPAPIHMIPPAANFIAGEPGTIAIYYNNYTGSLQFLYNDHLIYETERFDLPVGRAIIAFHVDEGADQAGNYFESIVVADKQIEIPEE